MRHHRRRSAITILVLAATTSIVMAQGALAGKGGPVERAAKAAKTSTVTTSPSPTASSPEPAPVETVVVTEPAPTAPEPVTVVEPVTEPVTEVVTEVVEPVESLAPVVDPLAARAADAVTRADELLVRPVLTTPTTITMSSGTSYVSMDPARDYIIKIKPGTVFPRPLSLVGGRNVVFEDAVMQYAPPLGADPDWLVRGLYLVDQTGVMWVSNLQIRGPLSEGIDLSQKKGASVVLRNIVVDPVSGSQDGHHADVLQTWAGPGRLVVDGLTGTSNFQGVFLQPADTWDGPDPDFIVLRNIHLDMSQGIYALMSYAHGAYPIVATDISVKYNPIRPSRDQWLWPKPSTGDTTWANVIGIGPV